MSPYFMDEFSSLVQHLEAFSLPEGEESSTLKLMHLLSQRPVVFRAVFEHSDVSNHLSRVVHFSHCRTGAKSFLSNTMHVDLLKKL
jgi:hypothetical protein